MADVHKALEGYMAGLRDLFPEDYPAQQGAMSAALACVMSDVSVYGETKVKAAVASTLDGFTKRNLERKPDDKI